MNLNARSDLFVVNLPKTFFPEIQMSKFGPYLERLPRVYDDAKSLINSSIQALTIPNINFEPNNQLKPGFEQRKRGRQVVLRSATSVEELYDKNFTITFRLLDGYINYWIMLDLFLYWYSFPITQPFVFNLPVSILDSHGNIMFVVILKKCLFTGLSEYELNYTSNTNSIKTFDASFAFNSLEFQFLET